MKTYLKATLQFILVTLIQIPMIILGVILVPLGLPFLRYSGVTQPYTNYDKGEWQLVQLPTWLKPWNNSRDGGKGDVRGYWAEYTEGWNKYLAYFVWFAIRNPANEFKRFILTCEVSRCKTEVLAGQEYVRDDFNSTGFQLLKATDNYSNKEFYHFYLVYRYGQSNRALVIELGYKFKFGQELLDFSEKPYKRFKGVTSEVNFYKDIS